MRERTSLEALLQGKCPRCRQGDIFAYPATQLSRFAVMNERCPHCNVRLEPEPGFYQGAMYVGYGFTVGILVAFSIILYYLGNPSEWVYIGVIIGFTILFAPWNYRYSRILYLYMFGGLKYNRDAAQLK
jgi:uncharacterized protein (DUF983 family)